MSKVFRLGAVIDTKDRDIDIVMLEHFFYSSVIEVAVVDMRVVFIRHASTFSTQQPIWVIEVLW